MSDPTTLPTEHDHAGWLTAIGIALGHGFTLAHINEALECFMLSVAAVRVLHSMRKRPGRAGLLARTVHFCRAVSRARDKLREPVL